MGKGERVGVSDRVAHVACRHPQFKNKGKHDSFRADNGADKDHPNAVEVDGEEGADLSPRTVVKPASVKQEPEREAFAYV